MLIHKFGLLLIISLFYSISAHTQAYITIADSLYSNILSEKRNLQIMTRGEIDNNSKLDVLYVTDAEMFQNYVAHILEFQHENFVPPQIIVGIPNNWEWPNQTRERDLLPISHPEYYRSGEADKFMSFIELELIPYINNKYPNNGKKTLLGHSFGGLFSIYTLLTKPQLFDSYIAPDPSCWYNDFYINQYAANKLRIFPKEKKTLYIGGRQGQEYSDMGIKQFVEVLKKYAPGNLVWQAKVHEDEHHGSVRYKNFYDGLKFTFWGYDEDLLEFHPMGGIMEKGKPIKIKTYTDNKYIRYTLDGKTPIISSPKINFHIPIIAASTFSLKIFSNRVPEQIRTAKFYYDQVSPPVLLPKGFINNSLKVKTYLLADSIKNEAERNIITAFNVQNSDFWVDQEPAPANYKAVFDGYLQITQDGYHTFYLSANDYVTLTIAGKKIIETDQNQKSFIIPLKKGYYPINLVYIQKEGGRWVNLKYRTPLMDINLDPIKIPSSMLWGER